MFTFFSEESLKQLLGNHRFLDLLEISYNVFSNDITLIIAMYCAHETLQTLGKRYMSNLTLRVLRPAKVKVLSIVDKDLQDLTTLK